MEANLGQVAPVVSAFPHLKARISNIFQVPCHPSLTHLPWPPNSIQQPSQVGPTLGYVTRSEKLYSCCAATAYSLPLGPLELPPLAVALRIAINTSSAGELPYGAAVLYSDRTETEVMSTLKPITNSCALEGIPRGKSLLGG